MFLKICGITRADDARHAVEQGATALGFVFWPRSPRFVTFDRAAAVIAGLPPTVMTVGVFVNESAERMKTAVAETGISTVQLHGDEPPSLPDAIGVPVLRSVTLEDADRTMAAWPADTTFLLDASDPVRRGGTGMAVDWARAAPVARTRRTILAGGLTPQNVGDAVRSVRPFGVDVSSGVEEAPGVKDADKVARFLANARKAFDEVARVTVNVR
jgi:phosphoribosylanthranilate isomerase